MTAPCDARCCDAAEVPLLEADVARLREATGKDAVAFVDESAGWWVLRGTGMEGGCVFLETIQVAGRRVRGCSVHEARPAACRHYPFILGDGPAGPEVTRDGLCPFRSDFQAPSGTLDRLLTLERQLEEERSARQAIDGN